MAARIGALLLAASVPLALAAAPTALAQTQTTGRNLTAVMVDAGPNAQFVKQGTSRWVELDTNGRPVFYYRERGRDDWSVYLFDSSRNLEIQLDIHRRKVTIAKGGRPRRDLYNILRFTSTGATYPREDVRDRDARDPRRDDRGAETRPIDAGPIWNQRDAETKCRVKASEMRGEWTGAWWTTVQGRMSVCEIRFSSDRGGWGRDRRDDDSGRDRRDQDWGRDNARDVEAGPIWDQRDAQNKCRAKADELDVEWTGAWSTVRPGMSVCGMRRRMGGGGYNQGVLRQIEVGPLWNQRDAEAKCQAKASELRAEWTGQWRTTVQGRMSECEIRFR